MITVLPFMTVNGEPVLCVVLFKGKLKEVPILQWASEINITISPKRTKIGKSKSTSPIGW
jgi:hypothetical protein